jgi:hypothetical protein
LLQKLMMERCPRLLDGQALVSRLVLPIWVLWSWCCPLPFVEVFSLRVPLCSECWGLWLWCVGSVCRDPYADVCDWLSLCIGFSPISR